MFRTENNPDISDNFQRTISILALISLCGSLWYVWNWNCLESISLLQVPLDLASALMVK